MTATKLQVDVDELVDLMEGWPAESFSKYLDLETGHLQSIFRESSYEDEDAEKNPELALIYANPDRFVRIPSFDSEEEYEWMSTFADAVDEEDIQEKLRLALHGKGAFARFKDVIFRYPDLKEEWFAHKHSEAVKVALDWLDGLGIEPMNTARPAPTPPPQVMKAEPPPSLDLLDMLVLGGPDGKTEVIGGRVYRVVQLKSPSVAQKIFKDLAKDICRYYGSEWRNSYIKNATSFTMERFVVTLVDSRVELMLDMPHTRWTAFSSR